MLFALYCLISNGLRSALSTVFTAIQLPAFPSSLCDDVYMRSKNVLKSQHLLFAAAAIVQSAQAQHFTSRQSNQSNNRGPEVPMPGTRACSTTICRWLDSDIRLSAILLPINLLDREIKELDCMLCPQNTYVHVMNPANPLSVGHGSSC